MGIPPAAPETWRVVALETPRLRRWCSRCGRPRPFRSTDRFRLNAQARRLDAWLIYRCAACGGTWNRTVLERTAPGALDRRLLEALHVSDAEVARDVAFSLPPGVEVAGPVAHRLERTPRGGPGPSHAVLRVPHPVGLRLDRLVAAELGVAREVLRADVRAGRVVLEGESARAWRRAVRDGQVIAWPG